MILNPVIFVFIAAFTYVLHSFCVKASSGKIDVLSGMFFWALGGLVVGGACLLYGKISSETINITPTGAGLLTLAGACIAGGTTSFLLAYKNNVDYSFAAPLVNISVVTAGLVLGWLIFKETISPARIAGVILGIASIILLTRS